MKDTIVLGIESSCDETSVAVVKNGREVLSNIIHSQIKIHEEYGGVVPEIASRCHIEVINQIMKEALKEANLTLDDMDAIAVTRRTRTGGRVASWRFVRKSIKFCVPKTFDCCQSHCRTYCSEFFDTSGVRTTISMSHYFWWTYPFSQRQKLQYLRNSRKNA